MKYKIITSSELEIDCWSTLRIFNKCHECNRVAYCKLPEAHNGRIILAVNKAAEATKTLAKHINNIEETIKWQK